MAVRHAVLYARHSTDDQSAEPQLIRLRGECEVRGFKCVSEFVDSGVSGSRTSRPALDGLLQEVRAGRVNCVLVVKLDRLARSVHHLTSLGLEFAERGVDLIAVDQAVDTTTSTGRLLFHMLGAIAEFERDLIRERTRAGLEAAKRRGKKLGRPRRLDTEGVARLRRMHGAGQSHRYIARVLGIGEGTVRRELARLAVPKE